MLLARRFLASAALATVATVSPALADMTLSLPSAPDGKLPVSQVLSGFGCDGTNLSPQLTWNGAPPDTGSFVVTIYDPDAPTGSGPWHWSIFNVPNSVTELAEGAGSGADGPLSGDVKARAVEVRVPRVACNRSTVSAWRAFFDHRQDQADGRHCGRSGGGRNRKRRS